MTPSGLQNDHDTRGEVKAEGSETGMPDVINEVGEGLVVRFSTAKTSKIKNTLQWHFNQILNVFFENNSYHE